MSAIWYWAVLCINALIILNNLDIINLKTYLKEAIELKNIIEVENLVKKYGSFLAVDDISFEGKEGEVVAFLGPNGAGKTTTMRILTCFMPSTSGTARIDGYDIFEDSFKVREKIGYLPEIPPLYPDMTIRNYLKYVSEIKQVPTKEIKSKVDRAVNLCGLEEMQTRLISKLSRGYKQRVGIAQAIIHEPSVIILDEPTVGLDPNQVIEIRNLIKNLAEDNTVLLSTHILSEAEALCKHIVIINKGKIVGKGTREEMRDLLQELQIISLKLVSVNDDIINCIKSLEDVKSVELLQDNYLKICSEKNSDSKNKILAMAAEKSWDIDEIKSDDMSLEEIFKRLTEK